MRHIRCTHLGWTDSSLNSLQKTETTERTRDAPAEHSKGKWVKIFERLPGGR